MNDGICRDCGQAPRKPGKRMRLCQGCTDKRLKCACGEAKAYEAKGCQRCYFARMPRGEAHASWKGGRLVTREGYVRVYAPDHPRAHAGSVLEHILVMEESIGRYLERDENVHHLNGDRSDNRIENLELWTKSQPAGQRVSDKVDWAKSLLARYEVPAAALSGRLPVAVDFDGTLAESLWTPENPTTEIGPAISLNLVKIREVARAGWQVVIHTARPWSDQGKLRDWLLEHQIPFDAIVCGKLLAGAYVDDRARPANASSWLP